VTAPVPVGERVGAVIVNYNAGPHLLRCVRSLRSEGVQEVVVVDNRSTDGSIDALRAADPGTRVVDTGRNAGYGAGANRGLAACRHELVLVGNPDIIVQGGAVAALVAALDASPRVALVGPRLEEADGRLYPSARTFPRLADAVGHGFLGLVAPNNRWSRRYHMADWDHSEPRLVDWVSGACFLARRSVLEGLGGFDESYFMYSEDVDLCWRARQAGWEVAYEPSARVTHLQGVSAGRHPYRMIAAHHRSLLHFAGRTTKGRRRALLPVVATGLAVRGALACGRYWLSSRRAPSPSDNG